MLYDFVCLAHSFVGSPFEMKYVKYGNTHFWFDSDSYTGQMALFTCEFLDIPELYHTINYLTIFNSCK